MAGEFVAGAGGWLPWAAVAFGVWADCATAEDGMAKNRSPRLSQSKLRGPTIESPVFWTANFPLRFFCIEFTIRVCLMLH